MRTLSIATDFSRYPGPRYRRNGEFSGQAFREEKLIPALKEVQASGEVLIVILDDVAGYGSSFLEEAFGGLIREGFSEADLKRHLRIEAHTSRFKHHKKRAETYVADAAARSLLPKP
ncbi:DUF4325 domain-containing protein [Afipia massiliensis]|uniref:DUF4325 domain-containing protein n=1 Tax=Afipia massiliensis TaxID=211460 RepID=A0A4U6BNF3_9BRAD|nr:STAS-like domain-containing protein [Afipia massiliensis]TKT71421.1 DUF4325 domain-containing protein [Afipia massiliensis]